MRIEPYSVGSIVHVINRGARGAQITRDESDCDRFLKLLFYLNDEYQCHSKSGWEKDVSNLSDFERPSDWPERVPLVRILAWTLMPNHFHLVLQEIHEGGISKFMQRLGGSMSVHFNTKYQQQGSLFQGSFRSRTIITDEYLRYCAAYVMVKNTLELFPGGLQKASLRFDDAWIWALDFPYSSFPLYAIGDKLNLSPERKILATDENILKEIFPTPKSFRDASEDMFMAYTEKNLDEYGHLMLEPW